mgnify:CR=1 FL=1
MGTNSQYRIELRRHQSGYTVEFCSLKLSYLTWAFDKAEDALAKINALMIEHGNN